ncbi:tyrosine-type recombinase/integrase [Rhizobium beringeri]
MPHISPWNWPSNGPSGHLIRSPLTGRYGSVTSADLPVIGLPPIPRTQIPPDGLLPFRPKRARPYLYSQDDIRRLLAAALEMPCRYTCCKLRPLTFYCLFGLLSVAGLRLGEARNLKLSDIDFDAMVLTIRGTKFGKSRLVPMHATTCAVLQDLIKRRQRHNSALAESPYLFTSSRGNRLDVGGHSSNILCFVPAHRSTRNR